MTTRFQDDWLTVLEGDCRDVLRELPDESVHCVVTSPPYWGLRDYGTATWTDGDPDCDHKPQTQPRSERPKGKLHGGYATVDAQDGGARAFRDVCGRCGARRLDRQIGLEPTPEQYVETMVAVFREVRRVLRSDGTVWLNLGDSYASGGGVSSAREKGAYRNGTSSGQGCTSWTHRRAAEPIPVPSGLKPKDLVGIPWRVAFALQADGWYLRRDIIWAKPNPMPESVTDRPTTAHEYVFLLAKSERYFYDAEAVREPATSADEARWDPGTNGMAGGTSHAGEGRTTRRFRAAPALVDDAAGFFGDELETVVDLPTPKRPAGWNAGATSDDRVGRYSSPHMTGTERNDGDRWRTADGGVSPRGVGRNRRSVWTIPTTPYPGAHFATFPPKLVEPAILAGCPPLVCADCGAPWQRVVDRWTTGRSWNDHADDLRHGSAGSGDNGDGSARRLGWQRLAAQRLENPPAERWQPTCNHDGADDDWDVIASPLAPGEPELPDDRRARRRGTGRRGLDRERVDGEGSRPMYRWQQRAYAEQLRTSAHAAEMAAEAGGGFAHYRRTDRSGARAIPPDLLAAWLERGWIDEPAEPARPELRTARGVVLDPFAGTGTVGMVAQRLSRRAVLVDLNAAYLLQLLERNQAIPLGLEAAG